MFELGDDIVELTDIFNHDRKIIDGAILIRGLAVDRANIDGRLTERLTDTR